MITTIDEGRRTTAVGDLSSVVILPASYRDLFALRVLERACFGPDAWDVFDLIGVLVFSRAVRLKAVADGTLIGFAVGDPHRWEGAAWIATIGVHPEYQRRGIGAALLAACEAALIEPLIKLTVRASNAPAISLYHKFGYRRVGVWRRYYSGGEDGIVMEKARASYCLHI